MNSSEQSKAEISQQNGANSRGPTSSEGLRRSSKNAMKLGLFSRRSVIDGESEEEFRELFQLLVEELEAEGILETHFVDQIAHAMWRKRRLGRAEVGHIERERSKFQFELSTVKWLEISSSLSMKLNHLPPEAREALERHRDQVALAARSVPSDDEKFARVATSIDRELERAIRGLREAQALRRSVISHVELTSGPAARSRRGRHVVAEDATVLDAGRALSGDLPKQS